MIDPERLRRLTELKYWINSPTIGAHEGSHIVVSHALKIPMWYAAIMPSGTEGSVDGAYDDASIPLADRLCAMLAGGVGECIYVGRPIGEWPQLRSVGLDAVKVRKMVNQHCGPCDTYATTFYRDNLWRAKAILNRRWPTVLKIGKALADKRTLKSSEIEELL